MSKYTVMNRRAENTIFYLNYEQQTYVDLFLDVCKKLTDRHGYTIAPLYQTAGVTLFNRPNIIFDTQLGFGVRRISPLASNEASTLSTQQVKTETTLHFERGCFEPSHIEVRVTLECIHSGTIEDLATHSLPLSMLKDDDDLDEICATINAVYIDAVICAISLKENPRNYISRNDFYQPALWDLTFNHRSTRVLSFQLHPYNEFFVEKDEFLLRLEYVEPPFTQAEADCLGEGVVSTMLISLKSYLNKMLQGVVKY